MTFLTALAALALFAPQTVPNPQGGFSFAGYQVPLRFPDKAVPPVPEGLLSWSGWGLGPDLAFVGDGYAAPGDWQEIRSKADVAREVPNPTPYRLKVVLFTRTDVLDESPSGIIRQRRGFVTDAQLQEALQAVARTTTVIAAATAGKVRLVPDVAIENDTIQASARADEIPFGESFLEGYLAPRINGGSYDAEDRVFRGPYHGVVAIFPTPGSSVGAEPFEVNDTPVLALGLSDTESSVGWIEEKLAEAVYSLAAQRTGSLGIDLSSQGAAQDLDSLLSFAEPAAAALRAPAKVALRPNFQPPRLSAPAWRARATEASIVTDPDRGPLLVIVEKGLNRTGGIELPRPQAGYAEAKSLALEVRSKAKDPLGIRLVGDAGEAWYSLGSDLPSPSEAPTEEARPTGFVPDGTWRKVSVDLAPVGRLQRAYLEPTPRSRAQERREPFDIRYEFASLRLSEEAADTPSQAPAQALPLGDGSADEVVAALKSGDDLSVLNALHRLASVQTPLATPALAPFLRHVNQRYQTLALRALANQGGDEAKTLIRRTLADGTSDIARSTAGTILSSDPPPNLSADLGLLVAALSWQARVDTVRALAKAGTPAAKITMMTFLFHTDPAVKYEASRLIDPSNAFQIQRAEWSAVNEPWDLVRLVSCLKLVQANDPKLREQGYRGVRDESVWVRRRMFEELANAPDLAHRPAILLGLGDSSYRVRAAAVRALAALPGEVTLAELTPVLADPYDAVLLEVGRLAKAKSLSLPEATLRAIKDSPMPALKDLGAELGG